MAYDKLLQTILVRLKLDETLHAQLHVNPTQPLGEYNESNF